MYTLYVLTLRMFTITDSERRPNPVTPGTVGLPSEIQRQDGGGGEGTAIEFTAKVGLC